MTPVSPPAELIVLLRDQHTGTVGGAQVTTGWGSVTLNTEWDVAHAVAGRRLVVDTLSATEVEAIFGDALAALPPPPLRFTLHFRFESDELTDTSLALVPDILSAVTARPVPEIRVIGHTDTAGTMIANLALGLRRAHAIRDLLVSIGLDSASIETRSLGESTPTIHTDDATPDARNRRVEVAVR
jgi:outer membrane protein OmpA-like peptidoglycan-associated protein